MPPATAPLHIDLIEKGFFPVEIPPAFSTSMLASISGHLPTNLNSFAAKSSLCAFHSIPRLQHNRRMLGIPGPLHQLKLAVVIESNWAALEAHMNQSSLSMTTLQHISDSKRGLSRMHDFDAIDRERIMRSSSSRFMLKADLSRFYHSLYTHSIPWALHSKATAKADHSPALYGNVIDTAVRNTQDKQTLGVPVGPITSDLIAEVLGTALDLELLHRRPGLRGLRYVDDYYLFFATRSEAEATLADLHSIANDYAVEINPLKTRISELPESIQPSWKSELRTFVVNADKERDDLIAFFSRAYENSSKYPGNNVLKYAIKHSAGFAISADLWPMYESFLLGSLVAEPSLAPTLAAVLSDYAAKDYEINLSKLTETLSEVVSYHSTLKQGFEVAWALWISKLFNISLPAAVWAKICSMDDSIVALLSLDLNQAGLVTGINTSLWEQQMIASQLYGENWLLAYEALNKGWLPPQAGADYVANDDFFGVLQQHGVEFYDPANSSAAQDLDWLSEYASI